MTTAEAEEFSEILPSLTIPRAEGLRRLWHPCELLGFSTCHRICTEIAKLQLHSTGARLLPSLRWVPCSHDGPREMTTAFDITGSGSWSKRSSLSVYHTHAAIDLLFINTSPFSSLCFAWKFCCVAWSPGWVLKLDSSREMAFTVSETGPSFTITIASKCVSEQQ